MRCCEVLLYGSTVCDFDAWPEGLSWRWGGEIERRWLFVGPLLSVVFDIPFSLMRDGFLFLPLPHPLVGWNEGMNPNAIVHFS